LTVENQDTIPDDLDEFNALLEGRETPTPGDDEPAIGDDETPEDEPEVDSDDNDDNEEVDNPEEDKTRLKIGKPKLTAKERIEQLNAKYREAERRAEELERRLSEKAEPAPKTEEKTRQPPDPDAVDSNGDPIYPLGQYDPAYATALFDYTVEERLAEFEDKLRQRDEQKRLEEATNALDAEWGQRLNEAAERIPDLRESGQALEPIFNQVDEGYAEYLANTLKTLGNGPDVLYYLSKNLDEAAKIFTSSPVEATIALGRLDGMLAKPTKKEAKKVSEAPIPPPQTRGTSGRFSVAPDTDDLDAFEKEFYKKAK